MTITVKFVDAFSNEFPALQWNRKPGDNDLKRLRKLIVAQKEFCSGILRREHGFRGNIKTKIIIKK